MAPTDKTDGYWLDLVPLVDEAYPEEDEPLSSFNFFLRMPLYFEIIGIKMKVQVYGKG